METIGKPVAAPSRTPKYAAASALFHLLVIAVLIHQRASWVAPIRLPGSEHGSNLLLTYSPGRAPVQAPAPNPKTTPKKEKAATPLPTPPTPDPTTAATSPNAQ